MTTSVTMTTMVAWALARLLCPSCSFDFSLRSERLRDFSAIRFRGNLFGMANIDDMNDLFLGYYDGNIIDNDDLMLLHCMHRRRNSQFPYWNYERFSFELMEEDGCKAEFWVNSSEIYTLVEALGFPAEFRFYNGVVVDAVDALCICFRRLAYPCRYGDLIHCFARSVPQLSMVANLVADEIYGRFSDRLTSTNQPWLSSENLRRFADVIHAKGVALDNCWGFVNGTVRLIYRPSMNQRAVYNVQKRVHSLKCQSVVAEMA